MQNRSAITDRLGEPALYLIDVSWSAAAAHARYAAERASVDVVSGVIAGRVSAGCWVMVSAALR